MKEKNIGSTENQNFSSSNLSIDVPRSVCINLIHCMEECMTPLLRLFLTFTFVVIVSVMIITSSILLALLIVYSDMSTIAMVFTGMAGSVVIVCGFICFFANICALIDHFKELKIDMDKNNKKLKNYIVTNKTNICKKVDEMI